MPGVLGHASHFRDALELPGKSRSKGGGRED